MIDVWVTGSSLPALDAALSFAEVGLRVRVSVGEASANLPVGPQRDESGAFAALVARVSAPLPGEGTGNHSAPELQSFPPADVLLRGADGSLHPLDASAVVGVPTTPLASSVVALLGGGSAFRAYLDRLRPVLKIGKEQSFGVLVRNRLGAKAEALLVDPLIRERFGVPAAVVDAARVAPGLNEALSRVGSLTGAALAYGDRNVARETTFEPMGGWGELRVALLARLALYSVELVDNQPVRAIGRPVAGEGWLVRTERGGAPVDEPVRAVVIDVGDEPRAADALGFADDPALAGQPSRSYVQIGIERPSWLPAGPEATPALITAAGAGMPAAAGVSEADVGLPGWTTRVASEDEGWIARFSGPRVAAGERPARPNAEALCAAAQVGALTGESSRIETWTTVASPISVEEDHSRLRAIREFDEANAALRAVGAAWAGGDLALALAEGHPRMVELRRTLLGIA